MSNRGYKTVGPDKLAGNSLTRKRILEIKDAVINDQFT